MTARQRAHPSERGIDAPHPRPYALVGAAGFSGLNCFGMNARQFETELYATCAPDCADDEIDGVEAKYLYSNVALGIRVAGATGATVWGERSVGIGYCMGV